MTLGLLLAIGGAALAVILAGIGSAIGVGLAGQAAGARADPESLGVLLLVAAPGRAFTGS
jgi:V/A-type H+-transporting ATPase subunit K